MGDGQHSISPSFAAEIDAWDGKEEKTFYVGSTSAALQSIGVKVSGIIWHSSKINKIMKKHGAMTKEIIKQVPEILEHPVAVLTSKQSDSRLVIFGTVADTNGDPVTAILELQPTTKGGQLLDMTVIASAYGKEGNVEKFVEGSGLVYLDPDRKRTENWMQSVGLQLPSDATVLGSIGSVSYPGGNVKIESVPYSQYMQSEEDNSTGDRQYSISEPTVRKEDVISDLRAILQKGGDPAALRQYVASLEQNTGNAEQDAGFAEQNGGYTYRTAETAAQILEAARARDISVEEYLEQNWERYDVDGQWNAEARKALEQEEAGTRRQYSISMPVDDEGNNGYSNTNLELRGDPRNMPKGAAEWSAFNRSFANKTSDIKAGEEREIYITTADYIYLVTADGYMQGYANKKVAITESRNTLEEYFDGIDTSGEGLDHWAEVVRANQGRYDLYGSYAGDRGEEENFDQLSSGEQDGDTPGDPEGSEEDYNWVDQEYLPGMLVYDGNGHSYRVNEEGLLVPLDNRQYSFSKVNNAEETAADPETTENGAPETTETPETVNQQDAGTDADIRGTLPKKAQQYLKRAERTLLNDLCKSLSVPWFARRNFLQPMVEEISNEYLRSGTVSQETVDRLFEKAYEEGVVVDREFYDQYVEVKKFLQKNPVTLSERNRADWINPMDLTELDIIKGIQRRWMPFC